METPTVAPSSTLFVADIPPGMTEETLQSLFNQYEGYRGARLRYDRNDNPVGFADFESSQQASRAKESLQGCNGISIHFSHGSSRNKRSRDMEGLYKEKDRDRGNMSMMMPETIYSPFAGLAYVPSFPSQDVGPLHPTISLPPVLPPNASSTLYVEGLPLDATEREVAHIFRPFPGYQSLRIILKNFMKDSSTEESAKQPQNFRQYPLCFVEYDNKWQATQAMLSLQGYRMDKNDTKGLNLTFAKTERKDRRRQLTAN